MARYLAGWGLRHKPTVIEHCRRWTKQTLADRARHGGMRTRHDVEVAAIARAMNSIYLWIARLARACEAEGADVSSGLVAMEIRKLLAKHPQAFLKVETLPDDFCRRVRRAARAVVPHVQHLPMPAQPLNELVPVLQISRWRQVAGGVLEFCTGWVRAAWEPL